jgi:hypothetical protein
MYLGVLVFVRILQICQNMYDFGEISLTCLTKYAIFFLIAKIMTDN